MIIRCPKCEFTRSISESKIPATAEMATCPKCKSRFRFRTLERETAFEDGRTEQKTSGRTIRDSAKERYIDSLGYDPEKHEGHDIWDTMDILHQRWNKQTEDTGIVARAQEEIGREKSALDDAADPRPVEGPGPSTMGALSEKIPAFRIPEERVDLKTGSADEPKAASESASPCGSFSKDALPRPDVEACQLCAAERKISVSIKDDAPGMRPESDRPAFLYADGNITPELRVERDLLMLKGDPGRPSRDLGRLDDLPFAEQSAQNAAPDISLSKESAQQASDDLKHSVPTAPSGVGPLSTEESLAPEREAGQTPVRSILPDSASASSPDGGEEERIPLDISEEDMIEVPWENPQGHGWFGGFAATVRKVMFSAPDFFSSLDHRGSLTSGYLFFLLQGYIAIVFSLLWRQAASRLTGGDFSDTGAHLTLLILLLLAPFALGLVQVFLAGCIRVLAHIIYPYEYPYSLAFKAVGYASAPLVVSIVPFVGPIVGVVWFLVSLALGCRYSLRLSWTASFLIPTPPALIMVALIAFFYI